LFVSPLKQPVVYKVFNLNEHGGVVAAFNICEESRQPVEGSVSAQDVPGMKGVDHALFSQKHQKIFVYSYGEKHKLSLGYLDFDIFTLSPISGGFAPIGYTEKYNSGAGITSFASVHSGYSIGLLGGGQFIAYCKERPSIVVVDGVSQPFEFNDESVIVNIDFLESVTLEILFAVP